MPPLFRLWSIRLKAKCIKEQELVIGGFTTQPKKPGNLGGLLLGYYERDLLVFAGKVGTGYSHGEGQMILKKLQQREQKTSPFKSIPIASRKGALFVKPELVAHVNFAEWTADGVMLHPSFQGLREDKAAKDVAREKPKAPPVATGKQAGTRTARKKTGGSNVPRPKSPASRSHIPTKSSIVSMASPNWI